MRQSRYIVSFWSLEHGFDLQGFRDDGGDNNHQSAVAEVTVAADLLPEIGDAAIRLRSATTRQVCLRAATTRQAGGYFPGATLGGDLLQIQRCWPQLWAYSGV